MQQHPHILPLLPSSDGSEPSPRTSERTANLIRFQAELEVLPFVSRPPFVPYLADEYLIVPTMPCESPISKRIINTGISPQTCIPQLFEIFRILA